MPTEKMKKTNYDGSIKKNMPASLGEKLRFVREEAGLSIAELAGETKIQEKYLRRLENEELDNLPSPVYIRGFLQKWAQVCNSEADDLLLQFYRENKFLTHAKQDAKIATISSHSFIITSGHLILAFVVIGIVVLSGYFYHNQVLVLNAPRVEILSPREFSSVSNEDFVLIRGESKSVGEIYIDNNKVTIGDNGIFEYRYRLQAGLNTIVITVRGDRGDSIEVIRKVLKLE